MKKLKKLAILLRALGFKVEVRHEPITFDDGTKVLLLKYTPYKNKECIYDQVYYSFQLGVIKQIFIDFDKYEKYAC